MFKITKIVVPVDFAEGSLAVEEAAQQLAKSSNGELVLLHVLNDIPMMLSDGAGYLPAEAFTEYEARANVLIAQAAERAAAAGVKGRGLLVRGLPDHRIIEVAEAEKADLVVMGTHGRRGFQHFMMGSVAERVVRTSRVPVLTVRTAPPVAATAAKTTK
jgi:nucleotide-binding universal stress UspA family protein